MAIFLSLSLSSPLTSLSFWFSFFFFFSVADSSGTSFWVTWKVKDLFLPFSLLFFRISQSSAIFNLFGRREDDLNIIFGRTFWKLVYYEFLLFALLQRRETRRDWKFIRIFRFHEIERLRNLSGVGDDSTPEG